MDLFQTNERWRSRLPHWEVNDQWHFVTIRCQGTLPLATQEKVRAIHGKLQSIQANSSDFHRLQRQYFLIAEKYLDQRRGFTPFKDQRCCHLMLQLLETIEADGWALGEATVMPNHIHILIKNVQSPFLMKQVVTRFKGRSARRLNLYLKRRGRFWQQDWFDRWMRNEAELTKVVRYIRDNPIKARLARNWADYRWRISRLDLDKPDL